MMTKTKIVLPIVVLVIVDLPILLLILLPALVMMVLLNLVIVPIHVMLNFAMKIKHVEKQRIVFSIVFQMTTGIIVPTFVASIHPVVMPPLLLPTRQFAIV